MLNKNKDSQSMSSNLNEKQLLAAELLAQGMSNRAVGRNLKVAEETICRWKNEPEFKELLRQKSEEIVSQLREMQIGVYYKALAHISEHFEDVLGTTSETTETALKIIKQFQPFINVTRGIAENVEV